VFSFLCFDVGEAYMHGCKLAFKMLTCGLPHIGADGGEHGREGGGRDGWMDGYVLEETGMCMIKGGGLGDTWGYLEEEPGLYNR
jgi:hypothetical protein